MLYYRKIRSSFDLFTHMYSGCPDSMCSNMINSAKFLRYKTDVFLVTLITSFNISMFYVILSEDQIILWPIYSHVQWVQWLNVLEYDQSAKFLRYKTDVFIVTLITAIYCSIFYVILSEDQIILWPLYHESSGCP